MKTDETGQILQKLSTFWNCSTPDWIDVDFTDRSFYDNNSFSRLKTAILENRVIEFDYYGSNGEKTFRRIEPIKLWFKHKALYIKGFCLSRGTIRIFKLTRMKNVDVTDEIFYKRDILMSEVEQPSDNPTRSDVTVVFKISQEMTNRIFVVAGVC